MDRCIQVVVGHHVGEAQTRRARNPFVYSPSVEQVPAVGLSLDGAGHRADLLVDDRPGSQPRAPGGRVPATRRRKDALLVGVLLIVLTIPLLIGLGVLGAPRWFPLLDMAQTELRVRDVGSSHPPLIGLAGRIGPYGADGGSHPGPLSFYSLWPFYQLFGATSWALQAAAVCLDVIALGLALWIAQRRGGIALALAVAAVLAVLTHAYGAALLTLAWNPYMPVLWWFVFLLAVWSLLLDDLVMLPVAAFAGIFCLQTHIPYLGLVGGMGVLAFVAVARSAYRNRADAAARRALWRWGLAGLAIVVVTAIPPVIDEIVHDPGNLTTIRDHFSDPPETPVGMSEGIRVLLTQLNPWTLFTDTLVTDYQPRAISGATVPGLLLLAVWVVSVIVAWRVRHRVLLALHLVIATALALGAISAARIFGHVWYYLLLWAWGITALVCLAIGWTVVAFVAPRLPRAAAARAGVLGPVLLAGIVVLSTVRFAVAAAEVELQSPRVNETLGELVQPTAGALAKLEANGEPGPYLVTFFPDPLAIGAQGFGLLNELDRLGFDVRAHMVNRPGATRYRVIEPDDATIEVHLATGADIARWRTDPRYDEVAYFDPRTDAERAEFDRMRSEVIDDLAAAGLPALIDTVDENLFMLGLDQQVPSVTSDRIAAMLALGLPAAVFIGPPSGGA
jgi:hypothetical protein